MNLLRYILPVTLILLSFSSPLKADETRPADYWLSPASPSQADHATLYFNAAAHQGPLTNLAQNEDVYLYGGVVLENSNSWSHQPSSWDNLPAKWKMTRDESDRNLYTLDFSPTIAQWFGLTPGETATRLNLIFRTAGGSKHYNDDQYLPLALPPEEPEPDPDSSILGKILSWTDTGREVIFTCEGGTLTVTPYAPDIVKVLALRAGDSREERRSISVAAEPDVNYEITDTEEDVKISLEGGTTISVSRLTALLSFTGPEGETLLRERTNFNNVEGAVRHEFAAMNDAGFYGGGYNGDVTNQNRRRMVMDNTQKWGWGQGTPNPRCINIPFYISTSGYGVLYDNHYRGASITPSSSGTAYASDSPDPVAYYYVGGGTMQKVMENYTLLTGRQKMPPYWALGYITSKYGYHSAEEASGVISSIKEMGLPLDGIVFDLFWEGEDESGMGNLDWYTPKFPDAEGMMKSFLDQGVHTVAITEPFFTSRCANYSYLESAGYLADKDVSNMQWLLSPRVGLLDVTRPEALEWMAGFYRARTEEGMSGWWLDLGEPEQHDDDSHHAGGSVGQVHNEFGNIWVEGIYNSLRRDFPDMRHLLMPRAGTAGMQRFSTFPWTGDIERSWAGLRAQIPALVSASMSGVGYMGSDCGGFASTQGTNAPLYLRWVEFATFSPSMRTHSAVDPEPYHNQYSTIADGIRKFVNLRYRYLPYTYTLAWGNAYRGEPLARPANFADSDPAPLASCSDAYLWGPDIFVAPMVGDGDSRSITFPEGKWLDLNDFETVYQGHSTVNYSAPLDRLPYFGRYGAFIPRFAQETFTNTADARHDDIIVDFIYDRDNPESLGYLYDDDHLDPEPVENANYTLTTFRSSMADDALVINADRSGTTHSASPLSQRITLIIHGFTPPEGTDTYATITSSPENPQDSRLMAPADNRLPLYPSAEALMAADGNGAASDNGHYYIRFSSAPSQSFGVAVGGNGIPSGMEAYSVAGHLTLSYAAGHLQYSATEEFDTLSISIHTPSGICVSRVENLESDGTVAEIPFDAPAGLYIARLEAITPSGVKASKSIKFSVLR